MRLAVLLIACALLQAQTAKLPTFEQYQVKKIFTGKPAIHTHLTASLPGGYHSAVRDAAKRGPNFAGKFALARWSCGSSCVQMAVINEQTGAVYRGPIEKLNFSAPQHSAAAFEPLEFRRDSRLLIARGCPEEVQSNCATFFYEWKGTKFRLLQKLSATPLPVP